MRLGERKFPGFWALKIRKIQPIGLGNSEFPKIQCIRHCHDPPNATDSPAKSHRVNTSHRPGWHHGNHTTKKCLRHPPLFRFFRAFRGSPFRRNMHGRQPGNENRGWTQMNADIEGQVKEANQRSRMQNAGTIDLVTARKGIRVHRRPFAVLYIRRTNRAMITWSIEPG